MSTKPILIKESEEETITRVASKFIGNNDSSAGVGLVEVKDKRYKDQKYYYLELHGGSLFTNTTIEVFNVSAEGLKDLAIAMLKMADTMKENEKNTK